MAERTPLNSAPIHDMGPLVGVPKVVGICTAHSFWFEARSQQETCPESHCLAPVHFYTWSSEYRPEDSSFRVSEFPNTETHG